MYPAKDIQIHIYNGYDPIFIFHERLLGMSKLFLASKSPTQPIKLGYPGGESFAVITIANADIPSVQYLTLGAITTSPIADVSNFHYIPSCSKPLLQDDSYLQFTKAALKTQKSLKKVLAFLSGSNGNNLKGTRMVVGEGAIVERLEVETRKGEKVVHNGGKPMVNFNQYCEAKCTTQSPLILQLSSTLSEAEPTDIQFFNLRSSNLKARDNIEGLSFVNILSGICLFSQEHLGYLHGNLESSLSSSGIALTELSNHLFPLPLDQRPTLYEIESLVRLPNAIADIVSTLPATLDVNITLDVPRAQYYAPLLDLYARGCCCRGHINSWFEVIDRRHDQIADVFKEAVGNALQRRGIDRRNVRIELSTGLDRVIPYIKGSIDQDNIPAFKDILEKLLENDSLFQEYYEYLPQSQRPQSLVNLCFASYSYQVLRPVFRRTHEHKFSGVQCKGGLDRPILIHIDNPAEWRIYSQAEKMLKEYQKKSSSIINPLLLGMFPRELIFTSGSTGRTSLYLQNIGQYLYDESEKRIVSPGDIVGKVYGTEVTRGVVDLMRQKGMFDM